MSRRVEKLTNELFKQWDADDDEQEKLMESMKQRALALHEAGLEELSRIPAPGPLSSQSSPYVCRKPSESELGLLYAWLAQDEGAWGEGRRGGGRNPAAYWSRAGASGALQDAWAQECGVECKRKDRHVCQRLVCAFHPEAHGARIPVCFAVLKEDAFTIDAIGTWSEWRGRGGGEALVRHCMELAREAGELEYEVDSLISALTYWRRLGL
jgi:ribosomal protein S18 acetylase RimI-like enzyme